jgi:hypothetical protein
MKTIRMMSALAVAALAIAGCEDITNPIEEQGQLVGPFVRFETASAIAPPEATTAIIFQMPTRIEEDVTIQFTFGGDAVFGEDFVIVDRDGQLRTDVTAAGGTAVIRYNPNQTTAVFPRDTLWVQTTFGAVDGRRLTVEMINAVTASGQPVLTGITETYRVFTLNIEGFVDIPTGSYSGQRIGDFGTASFTVTIAKPAEPIVVGGTPYDFTISNFAGAGVFGVSVPWAFNVTSGGTVVAAPNSHVFTTVIADVDGTFNFGASRLNLDVTLQCCGAPGFGWELTMTRND